MGFREGGWRWPLISYSNLDEMDVAGPWLAFKTPVSRCCPLGNPLDGRGVPRLRYAMRYKFEFTLVSTKQPSRCTWRVRAPV